MSKGQPNRLELDASIWDVLYSARLKVFFFICVFFVLCNGLSGVFVVFSCVGSFLWGNCADNCTEPRQLHPVHNHLQLR